MQSSLKELKHDQMIISEILRRFTGCCGGKIENIKSPEGRISDGI